MSHPNPQILETERKIVELEGGMESGTRASLKIAGMTLGSLRAVGGYQIFTYNLLKRLSERGHQVDLYVASEEYYLNRTFYCRLAFKVKPLLWKPHALIRYFPKMVGRYLQYKNSRNRYDVWQIIGSYPAGYLASSLAGKVPIVLRAHGDDVQKDPDLNYGLRLDPQTESLIRKTLEKMDCLVALSDSIATCYRELGVPEEKIVEIPNGVDVRRFRRPSSVQQIRRQWALPLDKPLVLTVGRNHPKKGYDVIPQVARVLKSRGVPFFWLVVGKESTSLNELLNREGVADVVRTEEEVTGSLSLDRKISLELPGEEIVDLYKASDLFVFPSKLEGFPRVIIEAMAAGVPVITTDAPGCRELVVHGQTGLIAKPQDFEAFASYMETLIRDDDFRCRLIRNGSRYVERYDWDVVVDKYEKLYLSLLRPSRGAEESCRIRS